MHEDRYTMHLVTKNLTGKKITYSTLLNVFLGVKFFFCLFLVFFMGKICFSRPFFWGFFHFFHGRFFISRALFWFFYGQNFENFHCNFFLRTIFESSSCFSLPEILLLKKHNSLRSCERGLYRGQFRPYFSRAPSTFRGCNFRNFQVH